MFHMENTQLDSEVRFSEALYMFKQDIFKDVPVSDSTDASPKECLKISTLEVKSPLFSYDTNLTCKC